MPPPDPEKLKYLKKAPEKPLPAEVQRLTGFLTQEDATLTQQIEELREKYDRTENPSEKERIKEQITENELKISDLGLLQKLLYQHADNPEVQAVSEAMNKVYEQMFGSPPPDDFKKKSFAERAQDLARKLRIREVFNENDDLHTKYVKGDDKLDDTLDSAQTDHILTLAESGNSDALVEGYATYMDRYTELTDKILNLPKPERDKNADILLTTVNFYDFLASGDFEKHVEERISVAAHKIIEQQETTFKGIRGYIQRGIEKGMKFTIDHLAPLLGSDDSLGRNLFVKAAELGIDLSKPVVYDQKLIEALAKDTIAQLKGLSSVIDRNKVQNMKRACMELKMNPDRHLSDKDRKNFMDAFKEFWPVTTAFLQKALSSQVTQLHEAYVLSHGEKNSKMFDADWTLRAKFLSSGGKDLIRLARLYSPFGIFLPAQAERKDGLPPIELTSIYHQGWFKEHPVISTALQGAELSALMYLGYGTAKFIGKRILITRFIGNLVGKPLSKLCFLAATVYFSYQTAKEIQNYRLSGQEKRIFELLTPYHSLAEVPADVKQEVRLLTLQNELEKRRKLFQSVGYDLSRMGLGLWARMAIGNYGMPGYMQDSSDYSMRDTMMEDGSFREAVLAANRKLVLLGLDPFEIKFERE